MRDRRVVVAAMLAGVHHLVVGALFGLGDGEALYVVYGRHPAAGYLDHPPLVGWVLALFGARVWTARFPAALAFAGAVLLADTLARRLGGSPRAGWIAAAALLVVPMFSAGSLATTPDALAAPLCLAMLAASARALDSRRAADAALAGGLLGVAFLAKVTALLLVPGLLWCAVRRRTPAGHLALAAALALALASPYVAWNAGHGWIGLVHRFVWTQSDAGLSVRNLGALLGGQLAYVGPPMLIALMAALRPDPATELLRRIAVPALVGAGLLGLWSRVAEPHWTAAAWLPLVVALGLRSHEPPGRAERRLRRAAIAWAVVVLGVLHLVVLTPLLPILVPSRAYDPRVDIANELHGWPGVARALARARRPGDVVAAGHWTMCAQLEVALDEDVVCATAENDDWDLWRRGSLPRGRVLFVTDARFPDPPAGARPRGGVDVRRGGRVVRRFRFWQRGE